MTLILAVLSTFGSGLASLFSWLVSLWQKSAAEKQAAADQMNRDIEQHSGDGALSVGDMDSAEWQIQNLEQKLKEIEKSKPVTPTEAPHA